MEKVLDIVSQMGILPEYEEKVFLDSEGVIMKIKVHAKVKNESEGAEIAEVVNRAVMVQVGDGASAKYFKCHPSGKTEDFTAKFSRVKKLIGDSSEEKEAK